MSKKYNLKIASAIGLALCFTSPAMGEDKLIDMSLEELITLEVTSVAKKPQDQSETAAALTVITSEDIRQSGVSTITEALRLAPGVEVTEIDGNITAVSIRGFNWRFSNKLLVLVDGRAVYQPSLSGIFWDQQNVPVEDIQRIEIVRGPGATMWGANAMNGVINIVTKHAADTLNSQVVVEGSTHDRYRVSGRHGFRLGDMGAARVYANANSTPSLVGRDNESPNNGSDMITVGFRADLEPGSGGDAFTLQGELTHLEAENTLETPFSGGSLQNATQYNTGDAVNLLGRWVHNFSDENAVSVQAYYDKIDRTEFGANAVITTYDLDVSHRFAPTERLDVVWGVNARRTSDELTSEGGYSFSPSKYTAEWVSGFVQGEFEVIPDRLRVTAGSKFEDNSYTGFESQPSLRAIWLGEGDWALWGAASRAVRTPSRIERDLDTLIYRAEPFTVENPSPLPVNVSLRGNTDFDVEVLDAYEIGFRKSWDEDTSLDLALFKYEYEDLLTTVTLAPELIYAPYGPAGSLVPVGVEQVLSLQNGDGATFEGAELSFTTDITDQWTARFTGNVMDMDLPMTGSARAATGGLEFAGDAPLWQAGVLSTYKFTDNLDATIWLRHVSEFDNELVGAYTDADIRLSWLMSDSVELTLVGENLIDPLRTEADSAAYPVSENNVARRFKLRFGMRF